VYFFLPNLIIILLVSRRDFVGAKKRENHNMADNNISLTHEGELEFFKLLMEIGATLHVSSGISVILYAAHRDGKLPNFPLLEFLLDMDGVTRIDKIDALEMAGAVILGNDENHEKFPLAFQYLRRALTLRLLDTEDCRPIYKTPLKSNSTSNLFQSKLECC